MCSRRRAGGADQQAPRAAIHDTAPHKPVGTFIASNPLTTPRSLLPKPAGHPTRLACASRSESRCMCMSSSCTPASSALWSTSTSTTAPAESYVRIVPLLSICAGKESKMRGGVFLVGRASGSGRGRPMGGPAQPRLQPRSASLPCPALLHPAYPALLPRRPPPHQAPRRILPPLLVRPEVEHLAHAQRATHGQHVATRRGRGVGRPEHAPCAAGLDGCGLGGLTRRPGGAAACRAAHSCAASVVALRAWRDAGKRLGQVAHVVHGL
jgi:hypothetical protein